LLNILKLIGKIVLILLFSCPAWGTTFIVDGTNGGDAASCVTEPPTTECATIQYVFDNAVTQSDTIEVEEGTYTITASITPAGTDDGVVGSPTIIQGKSGDTVVIDANSNNIHGFALTSLNYITIQDLTITGADNANRSGITMPVANNIIVQRCIITANKRGISMQAVNNTDVFDILLDSNIIHTNTEYGIFWNTGDTGVGEDGKAYNITINNNDIYDNPRGVQYNSTDRANGTEEMSSALTITNNRVYSNELYGIVMYDTDNNQGANTVSGNTIYDNGDTPAGGNANGLWLGNVSHTTIEDNTLYNNNSGLVDGIGIFLDTAGAGYETSYITVRRNIAYNHDSCNTEIPWGGASSLNSSGIGICCGANNNDIYNNISYGNAVGISIDDATVAGVNNKIYNNDLSGNRIGIQIDLRDAGSTGHEIQNNIISGNTYGEKTNFGMYINATTIVTSGNITIDYNLWYDNDTDFDDNSGESWAQGVSNVAADPLFVNTAGGNFDLKTGSGAINTGTDLGDTYTYDYRGRNQDSFGSGWEIGARIYPSRKIHRKISGQGVY